MKDLTMEYMNVEKISRLFKTILFDTVKQIYGTMKVNKNKKQTAWWSDEIREQIKAKNRRWKQYPRDDKEGNHSYYKVQKTKWRN